MTELPISPSRHLTAALQPFDSVPAVNFFVYPPLGRIEGGARPIGDRLGLTNSLPDNEPYVAYVSVPYCLSRCNSCMCFRELLPRTTEREAFLDKYVDALVRQVRAYGSTPRFTSGVCSAVFLGGGTASLLSVRQLERLLQAMYSSLRMSTDVEITLEGNPTDLTASYLAGAADIGVTRVSIGYQSGQQSVLDALKTIHSADQGIEAMQAAIASKVQHVNIDLLYNVPGQTEEQWHADLRFVLDQEPQSVSVGDYIIFPKTRAARLVNKGKLPEQQSVAETYHWYQWATSELEQRGYREQVREMFCQPGLEQQYVQLCGIENREILALGSGALGFVNGVQFRIVDNSRTFKSAMASGDAFIADAVSVRATSKMMMERYIIHNLYASEVKRDGFATRFDCDLVDVFGKITSRLVEQGLATVDREALRLTDLGRAWRKNVYYEFYSVKEGSCVN